MCDVATLTPPTVLTAARVADLFLAAAHARPGAFPLTNPMVHQLLYNTQGWHLAFRGVPLFADRIEPWLNGPVVPAVNDRFPANYGGETDEQPGNLDGIDLEIVELAESVWEWAKEAHHFHLQWQAMKDPPYFLARTGLAHEEPGAGRLIETASMREFFPHVVAEA